MDNFLFLFRRKTLRSSLLLLVWTFADFHSTVALAAASSLSRSWRKELGRGLGIAKLIWQKGRSRESESLLLFSSLQAAKREMQLSLVWRYSDLYPRGWKTGSWETKFSSKKKKRCHKRFSLQVTHEGKTNTFLFFPLSCGCGKTRVGGPIILCDTFVSICPSPPPADGRRSQGAVKMPVGPGPA